MNLGIKVRLVDHFGKTNDLSPPPERSWRQHRSGAISLASQVVQNCKQSTRMLALLGVYCFPNWILFLQVSSWTKIKRSAPNRMSQEEALDKVADYLGIELSASLNDYKFLANLNRTTTASFRDYQLVAEKIAKNVNKINENQKARQRLDSLREAVDEIDAKVKSLESLAYKIDSYSKRLEQTFKKLESEGGFHAR